MSKESRNDKPYKFSNCFSSETHDLGIVVIESRYIAQDS